MNARLSFFIGMVVLALFASPAAGQQTPEELLQSALYKQQVEGDLEGAVEILQTLIDDFAEHREIAASALVLLGRVHETLGSANAERAYQRVLNDYPDQRAAVTEARTRLAALTRPTPAGEPSIQVRRLMSGHYPDEVEFSGGPHPDGRHLAYVDWKDGSVAIRNLATGESRRITRGDWENGYPDGPKISPDGKLVAYYWYPLGPPPDEDSGTMLRLVGTDGLGDRFLQTVGGFAPVAWSWDSQHIAGHMYNTDSSDTEIVWISAEDGAITLLETFQFPERFDPDVSHSPNDRFLAVEFPVERDSARFDIALVSTTGGGTLPLVNHPADDHLIGWVPNTDMVLFTSDRSGSLDLWAVQVAESGMAGTPFPVRRSFGEGFPMGFTADGSLFYSIYTLQYDKNVAPFDERTGTILLEESEPLRGTHDNNHSAWSPTGDQLVLAYREGGVGTEGEGFTLRVRDLEEDSERVLTRDINPGTVAGPQWIQGGQAILTVGMDPRVRQEDWSGTPAGLFRIDAGTGEVSRLFDFIPDGGWWSSIGLTPTSDGRGVFYIHNGRLVHRDLESGTEEEFYRHPDLASGTLALSPDGLELIFGIADSTVTDPPPSSLLSKGGRLMVIPSTGGAPRELTKLEEPGRMRMRGVAWTSDGNHVLFLMTGKVGSALLRVPHEGGVPERVWETELGLGSFVPSPDGRRVTYMTQTNEAEIWVMENLVAVLKEREAGR